MRIVRKRMIAVATAATVTMLLSGCPDDPNGPAKPRPGRATIGATTLHCGLVISLSRQLVLCGDWKGVRQVRIRVNFDGVTTTKTPQQLKNINAPPYFDRVRIKPRESFHTSITVSFVDGNAPNHIECGTAYDGKQQQYRFSETEGTVTCTATNVEEA